ncbi:MAG: hypothetical protein ACRCYC_15745 [Paraclostridium sp.]|uniref:hypothetical protein n=1 Tax=Paraclostridium sp. TaxID=2023273 RepID=UPI003AA35599
MLYSQITWFIRKEDLQKNIIISNSFVLSPEEISIIFGTVTLKDGTLANGFGVCLEEIDKTSNISIDKCFTFTNEEGKYYFSFIPLENKIYNVVVYRYI